MGRRRKIKLDELEKRILRCACGRACQVNDKKVTEVTCCLCALNLKPIPEGYWDDIVEAEKRAADAKAKPKKRGRPKGSKNKSTMEKERKSKLAETKKVDEPSPKKGGRKKKEKSMSKSVKKTEKKSAKGKRGRKPTVGAKVLSYIQEQKENVMFNDILNVYSTERERLGKKSSPEIEKRNCLSTLYIMKRDGKIREVKPKSVYAAI